MPTNLLGQIWVDGKKVETVAGPEPERLYVNEEGRTVTNVIINQNGVFSNEGSIVGTVELNGNGAMSEDGGRYSTRIHNGFGYFQPFSMSPPPGTTVGESGTGSIKNAVIRGGEMFSGRGAEVYFSQNPFQSSNYTGGSGTGDVGNLDLYGGRLVSGLGGGVTYHGSSGTISREASSFTGGNGTGTIKTLNVYDEATVYNGYGGTVSYITSSGGGSNASSYTGGVGTGTIETLNVHNGSTVDNGVGGAVLYSPGHNVSSRDTKTFTGSDSTGTIGILNVYDGSTVRNGIGGDAEDASFPTSQTNSNVAQAGNGIGIIGTANIHYGTVTNGVNGTAFGENPQFTAGAGIGKITTANVYAAGVLNNSAGSTVGEANIQGGIVRNGGHIDELNYKSGVYIKEYDGSAGSVSSVGSIGTLTLGGNSAGIEWGNVDNLSFASDGSGILSIKAIAAAPVEPAMQNFAAFSAAAAEVPANFIFTGINAKNIDMTNGTLVIDFSDLGGDAATILTEYIGAEGSLPFADILGENAEKVSGKAKAVNVGVIEGLSDDDMETVMGIVSNNLEFIHVSDASTVYTSYAVAAVPEPATLVMFGLGLAGLGLARRRK